MSGLVDKSRETKLGAQLINKGRYSELDSESWKDTLVRFGEAKVKAARRNGGTATWRGMERLLRWNGNLRG